MRCDEEATPKERCAEDRARETSGRPGRMTCATGRKTRQKKGRAAQVEHFNGVYGKSHRLAG